MFLITSIAYLNKKRKLQAELQEMPLPKHVCWGHSLESDSLLASSTEPKKVQSNNVVRGGESDTESARDSNSFHCNEDSIMSIDYESKTETECPETSAASYERTSSSVSWADSTSEISLYSSKSTSLTKSCCSEPESLSVTKQLDRPDSEYELDPSLNYDCSEYRNEGIEHCTEKELENLLYSNGVAPGNYVLSSGRWSVNQGDLIFSSKNFLPFPFGLKIVVKVFASVFMVADTQQEGKKLTIDKEFEQYFAMLML